MVPTMNMGYVPSPYHEFIKEIYESYKDVDMKLEKCNCGKKKPPKK